MISLANGGMTPDPRLLRQMALHWVRTAAENPDRLAEILGPTRDTPDNRKLLAKILRNLAGPDSDPLTEAPCNSKRPKTSSL